MCDINIEKYLITVIEDRDRSMLLIIVSSYIIL